MFAIRPPRADELPALKAFLAACGLPSEDLAEAHLAHFRILAQSQRIVGSAGIEKLGSDALLRSVAIDATLRGEGYGVRLLQEIEACAQAQGVHDLYLLTTTADSFFEHHGYRRIDRADVPEPVRNTAQFAALCPASAVCLRKSLSSISAVPI